MRETVNPDAWDLNELQCLTVFPAEVLTGQAKLSLNFKTFTWDSNTFMRGSKSTEKSGVVSVGRTVLKTSLK